MLDLAIPEDVDGKGRTIVVTNHDEKMSTDRWSQDSDFGLVAFPPSGRACRVLWPEELAADIATALKALDQAGALTGRKPGWYRRLARCASGTR